MTCALSREITGHTPLPRSNLPWPSLRACGHTHGGQICLPGGIPVLTLAGSPRALARGLWRYRGMVGYTSAGTGTSIVDVRLNCPPEVTLHRLRAQSDAPQ